MMSMICVNDGSTDNSFNILKQYQQKFSNLRIINQENQGVSVARNKGLDVAVGDYIWFIDSDDFIQTDILEHLKEIAGYKKYDRIVTGFYIFNLYLTKEEIEKKEKNELKINANHYDSVVTTSLFRREYLIDNHVRFNYPNVTDGEDTIFMYEFNLHAPVKVELNKPYYFYRQRGNSAMTEMTPEAKKRRQMSYLQIAKIMKKYYDKNSGDPVDTANCLMSFLWLELYSLAHMKLKESAKYLKELKQENLYPFKCPTACTLIKSYSTTRTDIIGKVSDKIWINMHTRLGWWMMRFFIVLVRLKRRIEI